jgi:hypothetical protein
VAPRAGKPVGIFLEAALWLRSSTREIAGQQGQQYGQEAAARGNRQTITLTAWLLQAAESAFEAKSGRFPLALFKHSVRRLTAGLFLVLFSIMLAGGHFTVGGEALRQASSPDAARMSPNGLAPVATAPLASSASGELPIQGGGLPEYGKLPIHFEPNEGQAPAAARFVSRAPGYLLMLEPTGATLALSQTRTDAPCHGAATVPRSVTFQCSPAENDPSGAEGERRHGADAVLRMEIVGANPSPVITPEAPLPGLSHYFLGPDPSAWRTDIRQFARVRYRSVYPGVDLVYYGNQRQLEYDFIVAPGVDPSSIAVGFEGPERMEIDADGDLLLYLAGGVVRQQRPIAYQEGLDGGRIPVAAQYAVRGDARIGFALGAYDPSRPLVIDPVIVYSTYLGGSGEDIGLGITVDHRGQAVVVGVTQSANFPTQNPSQPALGGSADAFVAKLNAQGTALLFSTYLGGSDEETWVSVAVDPVGDIYLAGGTRSANFPTTAGVLAPTRPAKADPNNTTAFVTKLNGQTSALIYSTYLGGSGIDSGQDVKVDAAGNAYVVGNTSSTTFPTTVGAFQTTNAGNFDVFVAKVNPAATGLEYSTLLGGALEDSGFSIAIDPTGHAYVSGRTQSGNFPVTAGSFQTSLGGGFDAFVTKLEPDGSGLVYSTYLGGSGNEDGKIAIDTAGHAYVGGGTNSPNFPTANAFQTMLPGSFAGYITKLNPAGSALIYSTYLGGNGVDQVWGIAVDGIGTAFVTGLTTSPDFPVVDAWDAALGGMQDAFVTRMNAAGTAPLYSSYLGGSGTDSGLAMALAGAVYVTGVTNSTDFPVTPGVVGGTFNGGVSDAFVTKISHETAYFAEGASGSVPGFGFDLRFAIANPHPTMAAHGTLFFLDEAGVTTLHHITVEPLARLTVDTRDPAIFGDDFRAFSTVLRSDLPLIFSRLMSWDEQGYGAHLENSIAEPRTTWYLAEGATGPFSLFYLLQNTHPTQAATVTVTYLRLIGEPLTQTVVVPPATRQNIHVNTATIGGVPGALASDEFSARFESDIPIIVERAMYLDAGGLIARAGHGSAGIPEPQTSWFLAEGATGPWFDLFYALSNPGETAATVQIEYLLPDGTVLTKSYPVPAQSRQTIYVDDERFPDPDGPQLLADTAVAARITSTVPIVVERAMWWPGTQFAATWYEAHASAGATESGVRWGVAEGEVGGPRGVETYILVANIDDAPANIQVTLLFDDGTPSVQRTFPVAANSRFNVAMLVQFADIFAPGGHKRFSAIVESLGPSPAQIVVEQAIYWTAIGQPWIAGTNALGTKLE